MLYSWGFGGCRKYPNGLYAHELGGLPLDELREIFIHAEDRREHASTQHDRNFVSRADGSFDGVVRVHHWGITLQNGSTHGANWKEILSGCSLTMIQRLLAVAIDAREAR